MAPNESSSTPLSSTRQQMQLPNADTPKDAGAGGKFQKKGPKPVSAGQPSGQNR
jgi:hypothetical protein